MLSPCREVGVTIPVVVKESLGNEEPFIVDIHSRKRVSRSIYYNNDNNLGFILITIRVPILSEENFMLALWKQLILCDLDYCS